MNAGPGCGLTFLGYSAGFVALLIFGPPWLAILWLVGFPLIASGWMLPGGIPEPGRVVARIGCLTLSLIALGFLLFALFVVAIVRAV